MLARPEYGWSDFQLPGTGVYELSYVNDIAVEWLDQTIRGLDALTPFCVKGFMEPDRVLCVVSFWNCHIIQEDDDRNPLGPEDVKYELSHTSMLEFCKALCQDIRENLDDWVSFVDYADVEGLFDFQKRKEMIETRLLRLEGLITSREKCFDGNGFFS